MIFIKILFPLFIISFGSSVSCSDEDDKIVNQQNVGRLTRQRYKFNHPPTAENYQPIPVAIVYDEEAREHKSLEPTVSTSTVKSPADFFLSKTKTTNKITSSTVPYDDNDIEVKIFRHHKNSNQKDIKLKTHFENVLQIPVAVVYDEPNEAPNIKRSSTNSPARERVRGFILRKLDDKNEPSQSDTKIMQNPVLNNSQKNTVPTETQKEHGNRTTSNTQAKHLNKADSMNNKFEPSQSETKIMQNPVLNNSQKNTVPTETQKEHGNRTTSNTQAKHLNKADSMIPNADTLNAGKINLPKEIEIDKSDHMTGSQKENTNTKLSKSDIIQTSNKVNEKKNNENSATTKPQTIENQKEHGNRTSSKVGTIDILNSRRQANQKESIPHKINTEKDDVETAKSPVEDKDKIKDAAAKLDIKDMQKENGNRTSTNTRTINVSSNQRRTEKKEKIIVTHTEDSNPQTSEAVDTANVPKFAKRTRGRDPVVPIIESENRVYTQNGVFKYSYEGGDGTKAFEKGELKMFDDEKTGEAVIGGFSYTDKEGNDFSLSYTADEKGYRPVGAHLPTPPPIPPAIARALLYLATKPTPEPDTDSVTKSYKDY